MPRRAAFVAVGCVLLALGACGDDSSTGPSQSASKPAVEHARPENGRPAVSSRAKAIAELPPPRAKLPSGPPPRGLVVEDLVEGTGAVAEVGDDLGVRYIGVNYRTGKEFEDSSDATFEFELGSGFTNEGWERGLRGMRAGGRRELIVPPNLAPFGKETLIYVVDLVAVR